MATFQGLNWKKGTYLFTDDRGWFLNIHPRSFLDGERHDPGALETASTDELWATVFKEAVFRKVLFG